MGTKLLLLLLLISLASAGLRLGTKWQPRGSYHNLKGKGDYQILSRRNPHDRLPWKPPYNRRG